MLGVDPTGAAQKCRDTLTTTGAI